jgi:hypothetical protein
MTVLAVRDSVRRDRGLDSISCDNPGSGLRLGSKDCDR